MNARFQDNFPNYRPLFRLCPVFTVLFLLLNPAMFQQAQAYMLRSSYFPPEMSHADNLRQRVQIPEDININTASFNQLMILPGLDESLALKIIRSRPMADIQDFYHLPGVGSEEIKRLIKQLEPRVVFK